MTVVLITSINRYIGDTADTKPTGVPAGSTYFDRETGILYITYDGTNYVEKPSEDTLATLLAGGLPAALAAGGGLKTEGVAGGVAQPVSGTVTANEGTARTYTTWASGELAGSASALQMPSVACKLVKFKAVLSNAGNVYIGITGVTKVDGTTDTTTGLEIGPGDETPWLPVDNVNRFYRICENAGDDLTYLVAVS